MTELEQFIVDAIKTESKVEKIKANGILLTETISILIAAGNMLDQIKKNAFYDKQYNINQLSIDVYELNRSIKIISDLKPDEIVDKKDTFEINPRIFHSIVGIATESTELLEALDLSGKNMDNVNIGEEFGDIDWYKAIGCDELDIEWATILKTVIDKLKTRYPNAFTSEDAINRDLNKEREVLETMET